MEAVSEGTFSGNLIRTFEKLASSSAYLRYMRVFCEHMSPTHRSHFFLSSVSLDASCRLRKSNMFVLLSQAYTYLKSTPTLPVTASLFGSPQQQRPVSLSLSPLSGLSRTPHPVRHPYQLPPSVTS